MGGHYSWQAREPPFEGDCMLTQQDLVQQRTWPDAVSFGGWAMDLHPADGVYSEQSGCTQWWLRGMIRGLDCRCNRQSRKASARSTSVAWLLIHPFIRKQEFAS